MTQTTELAPRQQQALEWQNWMRGMIPRLESMHPDSTGLAAATVEMMIGAANANATLFDCTKMSVWRCVSQAASMGLVPGNEILGEYYIIPRKNGALSRKHNKTVRDATPMVGYKGYLKLMMKNPSVVAVNAYLHYENDLSWSIGYGTNPHISHEPAFPEGSADEVLHAYAVATMRGGGHIFAVLGVEELEETRNRYGSTRPDSVWQTHRKQMYLKTAIRRLANKVPMVTGDPLVEVMAMDTKEDRGQKLVAEDFRVDEDEPDQPILEAPDEPSRD
jgi:phage RecT family recombinase